MDLVMLEGFYFLSAHCGGAVDNEMDGEALGALLATVQGPECLKDLIPKLGVRAKVYQ